MRDETPMMMKLVTINSTLKQHEDDIQLSISESEPFTNGCSNSLNGIVSLSLNQQPNPVVGQGIQMISHQSQVQVVQNQDKIVKIGASSLSHHTPDMAHSSPVYVQVPLNGQVFEFEHQHNNRGRSHNDIQQYQVVIPEPVSEAPVHVRLPVSMPMPATTNPAPATISSPYILNSIGSTGLTTLNTDHDYLTVAANEVPIMSDAIITSCINTSTCVTQSRSEAMSVPSHCSSNAHNSSIVPTSSALLGAEGVEELIALPYPGDSNDDGRDNQTNTVVNHQPMLFLWDVGKNVLERSNNVTLSNSCISKTPTKYVSGVSVSVAAGSGYDNGSATEGYEITGPNTTLTAETIYRCKSCLRTFPLYTIANYHYKTVHLRINEYQCQWCKKSFPSCLKVHMELCSAKRANTTPILKRKSSGAPKSSTTSKSDLVKRPKRQVRSVTDS